ncbi:ABC transporter ATP-binding protein [Benzoatithermus flavus]|uniref:Sn-glycerol-3-phosphate ABC transporter ATP-binding protein UgpC n=1 Tax=Benzoatithermus flavus TaxID=3108223 RepID=A0ABU8XVC8_9PROT
MARLRIRGLTKNYGRVQALRGIDLDIAEGEFCVFVGPSGCGKSTLLRTIAGLEDIDGGTIDIDGEVVNGMRPRDRNIAMVFQNYALYPYLNVFENIAFGLRARRFGEAEIRRRVERAAEMLGISHLLDRLPRALSGGQRQRVAIGRAIVRDARLFLFDEPLSNLDAQLREGMRAEIKRLHQEIGKTTIYVTHDQVEAMTLADRIVLLKDGRIEQQGAPLDLFERPATRFVAGFLGSPQMNFVPCRLEPANGGLVARFTDGRFLPLPHERIGRYAPWRGRELILGVRPEHLSRPDGAAHRPGQAPLRVLIDLVQPTGTRTYAAFRLGGVEVTAELPAHLVERAGTELELLVDTQRVILIDPETERVI